MADAFVFAGIALVVYVNFSIFKEDLYVYRGKCKESSGAPGVQGREEGCQRGRPSEKIREEGRKKVCETGKKSNEEKSCR